MMTNGNTSFRCSLKLRPLALIMIPNTGIANRYLKKEQNPDSFLLYIEGERTEDSFRKLQLR